MVGGRRVQGWIAGRRRRHGLRRGRGGLGIADEDLCSGRQSTMRRREMDMEADDEAAMAAALTRVLVRDRLLEGDGVTPVAERELRIRARCHARTRNDEVH